MLKNLIIIEDGKNYQFDTKEEVISHLLGDGYSRLFSNAKKDILLKNSMIKTLNTNLEILDLTESTKKEENMNVEGKFVLYDEITYILSLLITNKIVLLEKKEQNVFTKYIDKSKIEDNYIIVNTFAKEILNKYINDILK